MVSIAGKLKDIAPIGVKLFLYWGLMNIEHRTSNIEFLIGKDEETEVVNQSLTLDF